MTDLARTEQSFSCRYHRWLFFAQAECPGTLIAALSERLDHIPVASWGERIAWGGIYINGIQATEDHPLTAPCKLEYYEPKFEIASASTFFAQLEERHFVYRDEELLVVYKPARLPCVPAKEQQHFSVKRSVSEMLGVTPHLPSRLDMSTQGLAIMSIAPKMHRPLQGLFERREIQKYYLFESHQRPEWDSLRCEGSIGKDSRHPVLRKVVTDGGKSALTDFTALAHRTAEDGENFSLIQAQPHTGRTHQIRVHAAHLGVPVAGDNFYGGAHVNGLRLLSFRLVFRHPRTGAPLDIRVPRELLPDWMQAHPDSAALPAV